MHLGTDFSVESAIMSITNHFIMAFAILVRPMELTDMFVKDIQIDKVYP